MIDVALGIDVGTSGVRVAALDRGGTVRRLAMAPMAAPLQTGGRSLQDPELWWQATRAALRSLDLAGLRVCAMAIDGTSGTILPIDAQGRPQGLASMYNDVADRSQLALLAAAAPRVTAALGSTSPLARALSMRRTGVRVIHQADWILGRLSGRFDVTDENNALKSGYDPLARRWPGWIAATGFDPADFPAVVPAGSAIGPIAAAAAGDLGLPAAVTMVAGTTDGCAAFLASGAAEPGDGVTSLGTTLTVKLLSLTPVFAPDSGIYSHRLGDSWLAGGASNTGGGVIARHFSGEDVQRLSALVDPDTPTGLDYYPLSAPGERFPVNDPTYPPRLEPRPEDDRMFFQAMLEGIAAIEAQAYAKLASLGATPLRTMRSVGGGAANPAWTKIRLRTLGVPSRESLSEHAAAGTARLAWQGISDAH